LGGAVLLVSQAPPTAAPGPQADGSTLLVSGWRIRPAGQQIPLDTFPMSTALTPDGRYLLVLHGGYRPPSVAVFDAASLQEVSRVPVADAWLGLAVAPNGKSVYVGGGSQASVFEFALSPEGALTPARTFALVPEASRQHQDFVGDVALSPDGRLLYAAMLHRDTIAVVNPLTGIVIERIRTGRRPYRILFHPDGKSFYVSAWADGAVIQHKAESGERLGIIRTGPQPMDMVWRGKPVKLDEGEKPEWAARIFIAAANTNNVYVAGIADNGAGRVIETISVALTPRQPAGMTPSALALSADEDRLYVVCADANAVAVADVSFPRTNVLGFIPTGWYPTDAQVLPDGRVFILNGKGSRSFPNPNGPQPGRQVLVSHEGVRNPGYVGQSPARHGLGGRAGRHPVRRRAAQLALSRRIPRPRSGEQHDRPREPVRKESDRARDLYRQGEPHLRSGVRRSGHRQRRPLTRAFHRGLVAESSKARARVRAAR
jgi:DNA-binding beta-propeller fold protein YncE